MRSLVVLISFLAFYSCANSQDAKLDGEINHYGAKISADGVKDIEHYVQELNGEDTLSVTLKGRINEVCQAKGCWMTLEDQNDNSIFIKFKDYAFFVPKDAGGHSAIVKGDLYASVTSVDELRHYAEDKGASAEEIQEITEPAKELKMMVEGVIIYNPQ